MFSQYLIDQNGQLYINRNIKEFNGISLSVIQPWDHKHTIDYMITCKNVRTTLTVP